MSITRSINRIVIGVVAALVAGATPAAAQSYCRERVMIPLSAHHVPGLNGSLWQTHLAITNHSARPISVEGYGICQLNPCPSPHDIRPDSTIFPRTWTPYLQIECGRGSDVAIQLRAQDLVTESEHGAQRSRSSVRKMYSMAVSSALQTFRTVRSSVLYFVCTDSTPDV